MLILSTDAIQLILTLKMTMAQFVKTLSLSTAVLFRTTITWTIDHSQPTYLTTPGFKPLAVLHPSNARCPSYSDHPSHPSHPNYLYHPSHPSHPSRYCYASQPSNPSHSSRASHPSHSIHPIQHSHPSFASHPCYPSHPNHPSHLSQVCHPSQPSPFILSLVIPVIFSA